MEGNWELKNMRMTKTGIQFKNRFWEKQGLYGGQTVTDLPIKICSIPVMESVQMDPVSF